MSRHDLVRWAKTLGCTAFLGAMVATSTGCGALSAAANPKVAWAINDPAPMSVVVRRADVAEKTAHEVDRIMTETPANDDSPWLATVAPDKEAAEKDLSELRANALYQQGARVVSAEVWAKSLAHVEPKSVAKKASAPAAPPASPAQDHAPTPTPAPQPQPAALAGTEPAEPAAPAAKAASAEAKSDPKRQGKGKKPGSLAKSDKPGTARGKKAPLADKLSDKPPPAPPEPTYASAAPAAPPASPASAPRAPASPAASIGAAPASAPAVTTSTTSAKYPSLLAAIDRDLGVAWANVIEKKKALGELKGRLAAEEAAADAKGVSDTAKKAHKKNIEALEKQVAKAEKEADKLASELVPQAKAAAKKAPAEVRDRFGLVLVNLRQAVDDAGVANGAAAVRYPMATTSLPDSVKAMAAIYVADVIEERTGKRPSTQNLQPGVTLNGTDVQLTLNGLGPQDLGKLSVAEVTTEVTARTTAWVKRALGLLGTIAATKEMLAFEDDVLGALIDGFKASGWQPPQPATIPGGAPSASAASAASVPAAPRVPSAPSLPSAPAMPRI